MSIDDLLVPVRRCRQLRGSFAWPTKPVLAAVRDSDLLPLGQLAVDLRKSLGLKARTVRDAVSPASVRVRRDATIPGRERYRLTITPDGIEILAGDDAGAYYAIQTLRDLAAGGGKLPACRIDDWPDFDRRAVYEDCSRGKVPTVETIKQLVERLAHWKINEFQLYVENIFTFKRHPAIGRGYSPFRPEDLLEIQEFCKLHHVRFVGSLSSFGHMEKTLKLPGYIHLAEMPGHKGHKGGTTLCPTDPGSIKLVAELYEEFVPLFEAENFNVCCDETWELGRGRSKKRADRIGIAKVYLEFLLKIRKLCGRHGKRMNAWADIILNHPDVIKDVPKDIVMLNWGYRSRSPRIGQTPLLADAGLPFMVCPGTGGWRTHGARIVDPMANVANFVRMGRKCGAQGVLNTDWGDDGHRNMLGGSMHGFAHGAAHSWNGRAVDDGSFTKRFCRQVFGQKDDRLAASLVTLGETYRISGGSGDCSNSLYSVLVAPAGRPAGRPAGASGDYIDSTDTAGLRKIISQLSDRVAWPGPNSQAEPFEKLSIQEFELAARMDILAAKRALLLKAIRAGKTPPASKLRALAKDLRRMARDFAKLWLARNRQSRLADNLRLFRKAERHCLDTAGN